MEQQFSLTAEVKDARLIISTSGYVNNVGGEAIATEFQKHYTSGVREVIEIIERLSESGGRLIFTNLDPAVEKMLAIMGLFGYAGKEKTVEDALSVLSSQS